jgi:hypothetical protein
MSAVCPVRGQLQTWRFLVLMAARRLAFIAWFDPPLDTDTGL